VFKANHRHNHPINRSHSNQSADHVHGTCLTSSQMRCYRFTCSKKPSQ